jgi:hypothetical protein
MVDLDNASSAVPEVPGKDLGGLMVKDYGISAVRRAVGGEYSVILGGRVGDAAGAVAATC